MIIIENMRELLEVVEKWHENNLWVIDKLVEQTHDAAALAAYENCVNIFKDLPLDTAVIIKEEFEDNLFEDE